MSQKVNDRNPWRLIHAGLSRYDGGTRVCDLCHNGLFAPDFAGPHKAGCPIQIVQDRLATATEQYAELSVALMGEAGVAHDIAVEYAKEARWSENRVGEFANRLATATELLREIQHELEQLPTGIDTEADENETSPSDMISHVGGIMWKRIVSFLEDVK